jgi:hypothetical protein
LWVAVAGFDVRHGDFGIRDGAGPSSTRESGGDASPNIAEIGKYHAKLPTSGALRNTSIRGSFLVFA